MRQHAGGARRLNCIRSFVFSMVLTCRVICVLDVLGGFRVGRLELL